MQYTFAERPRARHAWLLSLALITSACSTTDYHSVTFKVTTAIPLGDSTSVFLTGSGGPLGYWQPDQVEMTRISDTSWSSTLSFELDRLEFKITRGTWDSEAVTADGVVLDNHQLVLDGDTTVEVRVANWRDVVFQNVVHGQITGEVEYLRDLEGGGRLRERDAIVWLPPSYRSDSTRRFPVLYMHDAQNVFDPTTSMKGVDWQVDETVDSLSRAGSMREIIVVAVTNTTDRTEEYGFTDLGDEYLTFLVDRLKPLVDGEYRTLTGPEDTAVMGSSMGGLISFLALYKHADTFSMAACLSPAFVDPLLFRSVRRSDWSGEGLKLYIDNGGDPLDTRLQEGVDRMLPILRQKGFADGANLMWFRDEEAAHDEAAWAERVHRPLLYFFGTDPIAAND